MVEFLNARAMTVWLDGGVATLAVLDLQYFVSFTFTVCPSGMLARNLRVGLHEMGRWFVPGLALAPGLAVPPPAGGRRRAGRVTACGWTCLNYLVAPSTPIRRSYTAGASCMYSKAVPRTATPWRETRAASREKTQYVPVTRRGFDCKRQSGHHMSLNTR